MMVTLTSDIIRDAYRESNLIAIGREPTGAQNEEALRFINRVVPSVFGNELGENLETLYGYDLRGECRLENVRLVLTQPEDVTVTLPDTFRDGVQFAVIDPRNLLDDNTLTIKGQSSTVGIENEIELTPDDLPAHFFYRADLGRWIKTSSLQETDEWPFPTEFDDMFVITLALRLNPRYNIQSQAESFSMLKRTMTQFRARYRQSKEVPIGNSLYWNNLHYQDFLTGRLRW